MLNRFECCLAIGATHKFACINILQEADQAVEIVFLVVPLGQMRAVWAKKTAGTWYFLSYPLHMCRVHRVIGRANYQSWDGYAFDVGCSVPVRQEAAGPQFTRPLQESINSGSYVAKRLVDLIRPFFQWHAKHVIDIVMLEQ